MTAGGLDAVRRGLGDPPRLSPTAFEVVRLLRDPDSHAGDLRRVLAHDPALSVDVMKVARCHAEILGRQVEDLGAALAVLGFKTLGSSVIAAAVRSAFEGRPTGSVFDTDLFWHHSLAAATLSRCLAPHFDCDPVIAEIQGLLHDIGKIVIAVASPHVWDRVILAAQAGSHDVHEVEERILGTTHAEVGAWLAESCWGLPASLVEVIGSHHGPGGEVPGVRLQMCVDVQLRQRGLGAPGSQKPRNLPFELPAGASAALSRADRELSVLARLYPR